VGGDRCLRVLGGRSHHCPRQSGLPGEDVLVLVLAALYAARHGHRLSIVASIATGAVLGDNVGYSIGREFSYRLLLRYRLTGTVPGVIIACKHERW
jgi:membrane protein DedA with SNARE-associated domain